MSAWVFDIPLPPSVNRTRKVHWAGHRKLEAWKKAAGWHLKANGQFSAAPRRMQRYELTVTLNEEQCGLDPDNPVKAAIDLLRSLEIIVDDSSKHARRIVIEWGPAPDGCRLQLRAVA